MKIADKKIIFELEKRINKLADSVQGLAEITDETLNTTVELTKHIVSLQEDFITVINRLNEVELSIEGRVTTKELFVSPAEDLVERLKLLILVKLSLDIGGLQEYNEW